MMRRALVLLPCLLIVAVSALAGELPDRNLKPPAAAVAEATAKPSDIRGYLTIDGSVVPFWSYSVGVQHVAAPTGGGGGAGKAVFQDLALTMPASSASAKLWLACAQGTHFGQAKVEIVDAKGVRLAEFHLTDVLISSYQTGGSAGSVAENMTLAFGGIQYILIGL